MPGKSFRPFKSWSLRGLGLRGFRVRVLVQTMEDKFDVRDTPRQLPKYPGKNRCMPQGSKVPKNQVLRFLRVVM